MFKVKKRFEDETPGAAGGAPASATVTPPVTPKAPEGGAPAGTTTPTATTPTIVDNKGTVPPKGYWPDDWAHEIVDGDEKLVQRMSRYASPKEMAKALIETQNKIRSGEFKSVLPKDATPEDVKQWRQDNGIPESPDKYDLKLDNGVVIGKDDEPIIGEFLKTAHGKHYTPDQVKSALQWYYQEQERQTEETFAKDSKEKDSTLDILNKEWGGNFRRNMNMVDNVLSQFPDDVRDKLKTGRLADGTALFNSPSVVKAFAQIAMELNPASTLVPKGGDVVKSVDDEISGIEKAMRTDRRAYDKDEKMQARYRELLSAREKLQEKRR